MHVGNVLDDGGFADADFVDAIDPMAWLDIAASLDGVRITVILAMGVLYQKGGLMSSLHFVLWLRFVVGCYRHTDHVRVV
jgi:hypothetical protein